MRKFKWAWVAVAFVVAFGASDALSQRLELDDQSAAVGAQVMFTVSVTAGQSAIDAVGFDVTFDASVLTYDSFSKGSLTQSWALFDVNASGASGGKLIVGGLTTDTSTAVQPRGRGALVRLVFTVRSETETTLRLGNLQDGVAGFATLDGKFTPGVECPTGDVNGDNSITSRDALLAFQEALGKANPPLNAKEKFHADVYPTPSAPDGRITASDALCIFQKALAKPSCLDGAEESCTEPPGKALASFQGFHVIKTELSESQDHDAACRAQLGSDVGLADWNDIVDYHAGGGSITAFASNLKMANGGTGGTLQPGELAPSFRVSRDGNPLWSSRRHYFVSRHDHNKPSHFLAHAHLDNYHLSLGSWYGTGGYTLCYDDGS